MSEVQVWVLSGVVGVALTLFLILFKNWINNQQENHRDNLLALSELKNEIVRQSEQLKTLFMIQDDIKSDVHNLEKRVIKLEQKAYK